MTDSHTVKKKDKQIHDLLEEKKRQLLAEVRRSMAANMDADIRLTFEVLQDNADKSVDELIKHVNAFITGNRSEMIDKIDEAIKRINAGTYGICDECGCEIPALRLKSVPFTEYCVDCQDEEDRQKKEKSNRVYRGPEPDKAGSIMYDEE